MRPGRMIDNPEITERLIAKLIDALPISARLTPELQDLLRRQTGPAILDHATVTWISYAGDEGGIVCKLDLGEAAQNAAFTSITHLRFDPRSPLAGEITAYQKRRVKRLQRQQR
jgi:hypothetical protein